MKLEQRRVLSVNGVFNPVSGALTVDISAGGNSDGTLMIDPTDPNRFFLDENVNALRDGSEDGGLLTQLRSIQVNGPSNPIGRFFWTGNFSGATNLQTVNVNQLSEINFTAAAQIDAGVVLQAKNFVELGGQLTIDGNLSAATTSPFGAVASIGAANINVLGNARFESANIQIGQIAGDNIQFGSITAVSTGTTTISEDSNVGDLSPGMQWVGTNQLGSATINSSSDLSFANGSSLSFSGLVDVDASDNIQLNGAFTGTGSGSLDLTSDSISMSNSSTIDLDTGTVRMTSTVGDIFVSNVETNNATASAIRLESAQSILDGTSGEQADLRAANGTIQLTATSGNIGTSPNDLNINAASLVFNATTGSVHITDMLGGMIISGASTAGAGGVVQARSPLTIAANVTVGATTSFIAGNSATAGDNITIQNGAIVTLNSAVAGNLTFIAGDDIQITSGRITTTGNAGHVVTLTADNEGVADADRGSVTGDGTAALDVVAANLVVNSADGINLDVNVNSLNLSNTFANAIDIRENDNLSVISATNSNGSVRIVANGNMQVQNVLAQGAANDVNLRMLVATIDGQVRSAGGSVFVESLGSLITMNATGELIANVGSVKMQATAAGADIVADSITAGRDILVRAGDDITLNGPITSDTGANAALFDGHIEISAGDLLTSSASVTAVDGSVFVRGTNINLLDGGDLNSNLGLYVEASGSISIASDINAQQAVLIRNGAFTVTATGSVIGANIGVQTSSFSLAGTIDAAGGVAVTADSVTMTGNALIDGTSVVMFANNNIALGRVVATNTIINSNTGNITDNNGTTLNVQASTLGMVASQGSIGASDLPGTPDLNPNAIDIQVGTLSANARNGMYFQQSTGNLTIGSTPRVGAGAAPVFFRVPFIGPATTGFGNFGLDIGGGSDLTASGPIKVKVDAGTLTITDGIDANGIGVTTSSGDILLWGENGLIVQALVVATNGDITFRSTGTVDITASGSLQAGDTGLILANSLTYSGTISAANGLAIQTVTDLTINSAVTSTSGSVALISTAGNVIQNINMASAADFYVGAAQNYTMAAGTTVAATGNAVIDAGGNVNLRQVTAAHVAINAGGNILDADADQLANVIATTAILNAGGSIGANNAAVNPASANVNAFDTRVTTLSSRSGTQTFIREDNLGIDLTIGPVNAISANIASIKEVKFNSTNPAMTLTGQQTNAAAQEGAEAGGALRIVVPGVLEVNDGADAGNDAIVAGGDILLRSASNIFLNADVRNTAGNIEIDGSLNVRMDNATLTAAAGTAYIHSNNVNLLSTSAIVADQDVYVTAVATLTLNGDVTSTNGQTQIQGTTIQQGSTSVVDGDDVFMFSIDTFTLNGSVTATGNIVLDTGRDLSMTGSAVSSGGNVFANVARDAFLGRLEGNQVTVRATNNILDNNGATANIVANSASLFATNGAIGAPDAVVVPLSNLGSIDLQVGTLAATANGSIYLEELAAGGSLTIGGVAAASTTITSEVGVVSFNGSNLPNLTTSRSFNAAALSDVQSTTGAVYFLVNNGGLTVTDGTDADSTGIQAVGEVRIRTSGDITVNSGITSTTSRVTALSTAGNAVVNGAVTANGETLIEAAQDVTISNQVRSNGGDLTIFAGDDIAINFTAGNALESAGGSLLLFAQNQSNTGDDGIVMASGSSVAGGTGDVAFAAFNNSDIQLARASGNDIGLFASGSILDANDDVVANTLNIVATGAVLQANNAIGTADTGNLSPNDNRNAIDLQVSNLAVSVTNSVYLREVDGLTTAAVNASTNRVNQIGGSAFAGIAFSGVSSSNGAIKLQSATSDIEVSTQVRTNGASNILLETLANDGDIVINQNVTSAGGDISIRAGDDIDLNANVSTTGLGSIHLLASNNNADAISGVDMDSATTVSAPGGGVRIVAQNGGDILLSRVNASSVSLNASNNIIDNNDAVTPNTLNIQASSLQMVATNGVIGNSDVGNATDSNTPAIDTQVTTLAAQAALGIYVREVDGVTVDSVSTTISDVFFRSTETPVTETLEDLTTTNNGPIKLQSVTGNIVVNAGLLDNSGISANGTGDVLLQTLANDGDITINGAVVSSTGDIFARANDDLFVNANITTALPGTIHLLAANNTAAGLSNGVIMSAPSTVEAANSSVRIAAPNGGSILLSRVSALNVSLNSVQDILDNNGNLLNVQANVLRVVSSNGSIGAAEPGSPAPDLNGNAIDTQVTTLAASARAGIYIQEADGVTVDSTGNVVVRIVFFNSTESNVTDASIEDLRTTVNGPIKLQSVTGNIVVNTGLLGNPGISANGTGDVLLQTLAGNGDIVVNAEVIAGTGDISVRAGDDIDLNASVSTSGLGSIHLLAANNTLDAISGVDMSSGTSLSALGSSVRIVAQNRGDILLSRVNGNSVSLNAANNIVDNNVGVTPNTLNVQATSLQMVATNGLIGNSDVGNTVDNNTPAIDTQVTTLAAQAALGIYVREVDGVTVDSVTTTISDVFFNSTKAPVIDTREDLRTSNNGPIKLLSVAGNILVNPGTAPSVAISANGTGDVLLQTLAADGDILVNARIESGTGDINLQAGDDITIDSDLAPLPLQPIIQTGGAGTIYLLANNGTDEATDGVTMTSRTVIQANDDIRIVAGGLNGDIRLARITSNNDVSLQAANSIIDNNDTLGANTLNVQANTLQMIATLGLIGNSDVGNAPDSNTPAIDISVDRLATRSGSSVYVREENGVTIGDVTATVNAVHFRSTEAQVTHVLEDMVTVDGSIKLQAVAGNIVVNRGTAGTSGIEAGGLKDVLLQTLANDGDIIVNAQVISQSRDISLRAGDDVVLNAELLPIGIPILSNAAIGTIYVQAANRTVDGVSGVEMTPNALITSGYDVRVEAQNGGSILLGRIEGRRVSLFADESILDGNDALVPNTLNVQALQLQMVATNGLIGDSNVGNTPDNNSNAIDTRVDIFAARASDGVYIRELDGMTIDTVVSDYYQTNFNSSFNYNFATLEDVTTTNNGPIKLQSIAGNIVVNTGLLGNPGITANGTGDVLLQTLAADGDIVVNANVISGTGDISVRAGDDIDLNANVSTTGPGSIHLLASNNNVDAISGVDMAATTTVSSTGGNVRIAAGNGGDILLSRVNGNSVSLNASNSIIDNNDGVTPNTLNVQANSLQMVATNGQIGNSDTSNAVLNNNTAAIDTQVNTLAARSATGIYVREVDGLSVDSITTTVSDVFFRSTESPVVDTLEDLVATNNSPIKLQSVTGNITVNAGTLGGSGVFANGTGDVLLQTLAGAGDIIVNANVLSDGGDINIKSADDIDLNANISVAGLGTISLQALSTTADANSGVDMAADTVVSTEFGNVRIVSLNSSSILLSRINAANVSLFAGLDITDNNGNVLNVQATALRMVAQGVIGGSQLGNLNADLNENAIDTQITTLAAASSNGIYVEEVDGMTVGSSGNISVRDVFFRSTDTLLTDTSLSDLTTTTGAIKVKANSGTLTVTDGADANGSGVSSASGDILLWGRDGLAVQSRVVSTSGDITFRSSGLVNIAAAGSLESGDTGLILANSLNSTGTISTANGLTIETAANLTVGGIVTVANGSIALISATGSVNQNSSVNTIADYYASAGADFNMAAGVSINATGNAIIRAANNLNLRLVQANNVALVAANVIDADLDETVNVVANNATLNATNAIGSSNLNANPDSNVNAIDLDVNTISTRSGAGGTYLKQTVAGGNITVGPVAQVSVTLAAKEAKFNSSNPAFDLSAQPNTVAAQENAESTGVFKLFSENGTITVNDGNDTDNFGISASGDILIDSRNQAANGSDVVINARVSSMTGHVTLNAADDVNVNAAVSTGGAGTLYINASNNSNDAVGPQVDGVNIIAALTTVDGDILINSAQDIRQDALVSSTNGDIGLIAARNVVQTATGDITTTNGDALVEATGGNWTMAGDTVVSVGGGDFYGRANGDITLGQISMTNAVANRVGLQAVTGSIIDANAANINIEETVAGANTSVSLRARQRIGNANGTASDTNNQAIDLNVDTVAADSRVGIYLREVAVGGSLTIDTVGAVNVNIDGVRRSRFDSSTTDASQTRNIAVLEDLTTTLGGPIKVVNENGSLTINGGANSVGINVNGPGNILLETRAGASDVIINASVSSGFGDVTLNAADDIVLDAAVSTGVSGTLYINAGNNSNDAVGPQVDGVNINAALTTVNNDILINSAQDIRQDALVSSTNGDIGLIAARNVVQTAAGDITTTNGDALIEAIRGNWTMDANANIRVGGGDFYGRANSDLTLSQISMTNAVANRIALQATTGSIIDANAASVNIEETVAGASTSVSLRAGQRIGNAGGTVSPINNQAIDLRVDTVAAEASSGIYLREMAAGGSLTVDTVNAVTVDIDGGRRARFDSGTTDASQARNLATLEDLITLNNGPVKVVTENGTLTINGGSNGIGVSANGTGNILLDSRAGNLVIASNVNSNAGHINAFASAAFLSTPNSIVRSEQSTVYMRADQVDLQGQVIAGQDLLVQARTNGVSLASTVQSLNGQVSVNGATQVIMNGVASVVGNGVQIVANAGDFSMSPDATVRSVGTIGSVVVSASNNLVMGRVSGDDVSVRAINGSIGSHHLGLDPLRPLSNIEATKLQLIAGQSIGLAQAPAYNLAGIGLGDVNFGAVDLLMVGKNNQNSVIAIQAGNGIYLNHVASGPAQNLNIGVVTPLNPFTIDVKLVGFDSSLTDNTTITAQGAGESRYVRVQNNAVQSNVAIDIRNQNGSIVVQDSGTPANEGIFTNGGGVYLAASLIDPAVNPANARLQLGASIVAVGAGDRGDIGLHALDQITETNAGGTRQVRVDGTNLHIRAGLFAHLSNTFVDTLDARVNEVGAIQDFQDARINVAASNRGNDFLATMNPKNATLGNNIKDAGQDQFGPSVANLSADLDFYRRLNNQYALFIDNNNALRVDSVVATGTARPNVYIETNQGNLVVNGNIETVSRTAIIELNANGTVRAVNENEGAIVLIAGDKFTLNNGSVLQTGSVFGLADRQQQIRSIGTPGDYVFVGKFDGGIGKPTGSELTTTRLVIPYAPTNSPDPTISANSLSILPPAQRNETDLYQRVILNYGANAESGFSVYVAYADGLIQEFDTAGDTGIKSALGGRNDQTNDARSIQSSPRTGLDAVAFTRSTPIDNLFLLRNQTLPTVASVRRADDFFIFENAASNDPNQIIDLTVQTVEILNVVSNGAVFGAIEMPAEIPTVVPPVLSGTPSLPEIVITNVTNTPIEFTSIVEKKIEVSVYQVSFEDDDKDGYADDSELPTIEEVRNFEVVDDSSSDSQKEMKPGTRVKKGSIKTEGTPTSQEIEIIKAQLMNDPTRSAGAYAIIERDINNRETVIEVFAVRDDEEPTQSEDDKTPIVQPKANLKDSGEQPADTNSNSPSEDDGAFNLPRESEIRSDDSGLQVASSGVLAGALWLTSCKSRSGTQILQEIGESKSANSNLRRRVRRARRIASLVSQSAHQD